MMDWHFKPFGRRNRRRHFRSGPFYRNLQARNQPNVIIDPSLNHFPKQKIWKNDNLPVRNQKKCAACYAFAAINAVNFIYNLNDDTDVSHQEILDCDESNEHCIGGNPFKVFDYINENGISLEKDYPYVHSK